MPKYRYVAVGPDGAQVTGLVDGSSATGAGIALLDQGLKVTSLVEKRSALQYEITRKKVPRRDLMQFSRQLAVFLRAGIPVTDALDVILQETPKKLFAKVLRDMIEALKAGATFTGAARAHPEAFPPIYLGVLQAAEMTGNLDQALDELADYIDRDLEARRKIQSALFYPGCVFLMSIATVVILTAWVLPKFKTFFEELDAELPTTTRVMLGLAGFLTDNWLFLLLGGVVSVAALVLGLRTTRGRNLRDTLILKAPVVGDLIRGAIIERFCRTLSSMVRVGVPLPDALAVTAEGTNNVIYRRGLNQVREAMLQGGGLATPLAGTGLFPGAARQMIRVGEETGTLDQQLETSAEYYERDLNYKIGRFTGMFEPAVIIFMGVVVGFVAIALVSAMYGIFRQVEIQ